jgi:pimeloyl-ACP methyl ester carboxylesterase
MIYYKTYLLDRHKEWVVFLHGAGGSSTIWFRQIKAYREHFNVLFLDLRGHGHSKHAFQDYYRDKYTFQLVTRDVIEVLDHLKIRQAHFVGVSLGTIITRTLEDIAPERVTSVVHCGAIMRLNVRSRFLVWAGHKLKRLIPFLWLYKLFAWIILPKANHEESRSMFIREAKKMAKKEFLRWFRLTYEVNPLLRYFRESESGNPTLYIMGSEDHMFLPSIRKMVQAHSNSRLEVIENCGHVCNIEQPDRFNEVSIQFLLEQSQESGMKDPVIRECTS